MKLILLLVLAAGLQAFADDLDLHFSVPNYAKKSPFTVSDKAAQEKLRRLVQKTPAADKRCQMGQVSTFQLPIVSNVCEGAQFAEFKKLVMILAPKFESERLGVWVYQLPKKKEKALLVTYIDLNKGQGDAPYLSLWSLSWTNGKLKVKFKVAKEGSFLLGQVVEFTKFGTSKENRVLVVKHQTCIDCEASSYLTFIDFSPEPKAKNYEFTMADDHKLYGDGLECVVGQLDEEVPVTVETRVLPESDKGPHILQRVTHVYIPVPAEPDVTPPTPDPDEWWAFTCKKYRCNYKKETGEKPSADFQKLWDKARGLMI